MEQYSIAEARDQFARLVRRVEEKAPIELTRRGKTVAVLMSAKQYQRLRPRQHGFWEAHEAFRSKFDLETIAFDEAVFSGLPDT